MALMSQQREVIRRCQKSAIWFMRKFVKIKHPGAGIVPFEPFEYQQNAIRCFRKHRMNIFRKTRQCGISKVSGIFALWFAMFSPHKTILIVSRKDEDAMNFLAENIKLPFSYLPKWMQELWKPIKDNEHEIIFPNGSKIRSLTSHPDVLRSNASSLNIIDESAFIQDMDAMWAAGRPTLQHGGSVIVISTTNGVGNWYWNTWTDAEAGANDFNPLMVNWWDMQWSIEYRDALSGELVKIAPTDGILPTAKGTFFKHPRYGNIELRPELYGPFWSPWLEAQYRDLQEKGEAWKFDQEVLAAFVGSGNTVLPKSVLVHVGGTINDDFEIVTGPQTYVHPITGDQEEIDFTPNEPNEGLWVWRKPVTATPDRVMGGRIIQPGRKAHAYVMGVDIATGKGRDYHALEVFDIDTMEQAAEAMFHCLPAMFKKIIDRVGRWYNCALTNVERNNGGDMVIDDLNTEFNYPRLWRKSEFNGRTVTVGQYGFFTSSASKPALNKFLLDFIRDKDGEGFRIYSRRLWKQLQIYVRKRDKAGRDTGKTEAETGVGNHDDLVMGTGLALVAVPDSYSVDATGSVPFTAQELSSLPADQMRLLARQKELIEKGGVLMPMAHGGGGDAELNAQEELMRFTTQLGGLPTLVAMRERMSAVHKKKHQL